MKLTQIAARERGPGPGRYALPSTIGFTQHDPTKHMKPAYSFGRRLHFNPEDFSPGPAYFIDPRITRDGMDGTFKYSMFARCRDPNIFKTPSADAYRPENVHPQGEKYAPRYSIGFRTRNRRRDQNPAPNKYFLPRILGSNQINKNSTPAYSMTGRSNTGCYLEDLAKAPGPGQHHQTHPDVYKCKAPLYSLGDRNYMPGDSSIKPGPGAHYPEHVFINKRQAPSYSLGVRHSEFTCPFITL